MPGLLPLLRGAGIATAMLLVASCFTDRRNEGAQLYREQCANCHGAAGEGLRRLIPPLAKADFLVRYRTSLPCLLRKGRQGPLVVNGISYNQLMPANEELTDSQITNLLNYVQQSWGNQQEPFTIREVSELLEPCHGSDGH